MTVWSVDHEVEPRTVAFEPCDQFRIPLDGDLMTCRDCGHFISDHETD